MTVVDKIIFDAEISERKILSVPINTIVATQYNPPERTEDGKKLRHLSETVKKYGVIQPILITADRDLVDGNRRLRAAILAGFTHIDCIILPAEIDPDKAFGELNTTSEKIGKRGWLYICRHGIRNPPDDVRSQYQELLRLIGTYGIDTMIERKLGLALLTQCKQIKATGVAIPLGDLIMRVAQNKLTNRINFIMRDKSITSNEVARQITEILGAA